MKIHRDPIDFSLLKGNVVTIGTFDGVHRAHRSLINELVDMAARMSCESVLVTFDPHPRRVVYPKDNSLQMITDADEKIELLKQTALDHLVIFPFTIEFSQLSAAEYVEDFLLKRFEPKGLLVGFDHRFGLNRQGDCRLLKSYADQHEIEILEFSKKASNDIKISSTAIRTALLDGAIREANRLLGYRFYLTGEVVKGDSVGSKIGYPTANIELRDELKIVPRSGIYAAFVYINDDRYEGLLYIGRKPSLVDGDKTFIEVNLRNFSGYLYGEHLRIEIVDFIREDEKFDSIPELVSRIKEDEKQIVSILREETSDL